MHPKLLRKSITGLTVKQVEGAEGKSFGTLTGYASTFDIDLTGDRIMPGAWAKSISEVVPAGRVKLIDGHNLYEGSSAILGLVTSAIEDQKGLLIEARFASTEPAQRVRALVQEGILSDFSVGFRIMRDSLNMSAKIREISEAALVEVSVVATPANPEARILRVKSAGGGSLYFDAAPPEHKWEPVEAEARFKAWVSEAPVAEWGLKEWGLYSSGYLFATPEMRRWLLVDVIDGKPAYVVEAAKQALREMRSEPTGPWREDKSLEDVLRAVFKHAGAEYPDPAVLEGTASALEDALKCLRLNTTLLKLRA